MNYISSYVTGLLSHMWFRICVCGNKTWRMKSRDICLFTCEFNIFTCDWHLGFHMWTKEFKNVKMKCELDFSQPFYSTYKLKFPQKITTWSHVSSICLYAIVFFHIRNSSCGHDHIITLYYVDVQHVWSLLNCTVDIVLHSIQPVTDPFHYIMQS